MNKTITRSESNRLNQIDLTNQLRNIIYAVDGLGIGKTKTSF
jgi:hypothetical protein